MSIIAKSVIFDIADNYGDASYMGVRSVDFFLEDVLIDRVLYANATSSYSFTYFDSTFAFDTSLPKTGAHASNSWMSSGGNVTNQRLLVFYLDTPIEFDKVIVNNFHNSGDSTTRGAKNIVLTASADLYSDSTYNAAIPTGTVLFDGVLAEHVASDVEDPQTVYVTPFKRGVFIAPLVSVTSIGEVMTAGSTDFITPIVSVDATGNLPITGYTDFIAPIVSVSGGGLSAKTGYTDFISPVVAVSSVGELPLTGYTEFNSPLVSLYSYCYVTPFIDTDFIAPLTTVLGEGNVYHHVISGDIVTKPPSINVSGDVSIIGLGVIAPRLIGISGVGDVNIMGAGHINTAGVRIHGDYGAVGNVEVSATIDSYGKVSIIGLGDVNARPVKMSSTGQLRLLAITSYVVNSPSVTSKGIIYPTGYGALSIPSPSVMGYGYITTTGKCSIVVKLPQIICHADQADDYTVIHHIREGTCR
jgi:hypothetical protein